MAVCDVFFGELTLDGMEDGGCRHVDGGRGERLGLGFHFGRW